MMDLNNIQLAPQTVAQLYTDVLIETHATAVPDNMIKALGANKKNILIIVHYEGEMYLPDAALQFLTSILGACKLSLADVALVNNKEEKKNYRQLLQQFNSTTVLLFDVSPLQLELPINFPHFQIQKFNGCTYLYTPELQSIEKDKTLKKNLWLALKTIFDIA